MPHKTRNPPESSSTCTKHHRNIPQYSSYHRSDNDDNNNVNGDESEQAGSENYDYDDDDLASDFSISNPPRSSGSSEAAASLNSVSESSAMATSYINIAPLPIFHGSPEECPMTHLSRFVKVCRANNASSVEMMMRIFPVTLDDEAGLWYDLNIEPFPSLGWEEIKASFVQAYNKIKVKEQMRNELSMMNQGDEECVRSYFLRLQWVLQRWPDHGISEDFLKDIFVDGLREDFQGWVIPRKPESMGEALRLAFAFEQLKNIKGSSRKNGGVEEDERERFGGKMMSQCQCSKHHCWKKQLQRTNSLISRYSNAQ
ncbi:hypothetical protein HRI_002340800 [Hibiscus trionum]|uniref:Retrotransposon gag domain-containing protein n=1 Tax=Hibiscus trionum TaxID=183268 RepID=A0A9W7HYD0_HIBTR|nr:hypothetical protein HRI_002340800 [Hibiscus trionum]